MRRSKRWPKAATAASCSASTRVPPELRRRDGAIAVSQAPGAFARRAQPAAPGPRIALLLPYGDGDGADTARCSTSTATPMACCATCACARPVRRLGTAVAVAAAGRGRQRPRAWRRSRNRSAINWRNRSRLPYVSAADLIEGKRGLRDAADAAARPEGHAWCWSATPPPASTMPSRRRSNPRCPASRCTPKRSRRCSTTARSGCRRPASSTCSRPCWCC